jgi:hypothetical protein
MLHTHNAAKLVSCHHQQGQLRPTTHLQTQSSLHNRHAGIIHTLQRSSPAAQRIPSMLSATPAALQPVPPARSLSQLQQQPVQQQASAGAVLAAGFRL